MFHFILQSAGKTRLPNIKETNNGTLQFCGFPDCDYIRQITLVLHLWQKKGSFPVEFAPMQGFAEETDTCIIQLNSYTDLVGLIFEAFLL